ncbi:MAG: hypothetical protein NW207_01515 [Cytophagales bacterium]|nr:hypothetical protein [Cytophagales bacterium]
MNPKKTSFSNPDIPQTLLWEYDLTTFNYQKSYRIVCERILQLGNLYQWREMLRCYTKAQIKDAIDWSAQLDQRDKDFAYFFLESDLIQHVA